MTARPLRTTAQLLKRQRPIFSRRSYSQKIIQENDVVLLQRKVASRGRPLLTKPLVSNNSISIPQSRDGIYTDDIIGKTVRSVVRTRKGVDFRILQPSLAEYTDLSPRLVTPIYSQDANLIVSLLDLHPSPSSAENTDNEDSLEIFEAGTGHGALTLHLARAVHGANEPPPRMAIDHKRSRTEPEAAVDLARKLDTVKDFSRVRSVYMPADTEQADQVFDQCLADYIKAAGELGARIEFSILAKNEQYSPEIREHFRKLAEDELALPEQNHEVYEKLHQRDYDFWRANRRAVIHTLDINEKHSKHAQSIVKNFRQGMYSPNVDFHVGTIEDYLESRLIGNDDETFLDHAILDLPSTEKYLEILGRSIKPNGSLVTWNPNITQILKSVEVVRELRLPFLLERVLEMGAGGTTGGREWDVRRVKLKSAQVPKQSVDDVSQASSTDETISESDGLEAVASPKDDQEESADVEAPVTDEKAVYEMVCRPKVGVRIEGGGFIGLWRRMEQV